MEWTNYSTCVNMETSSLKTNMTISIVCNAVSIALLIPALAIFLLLRDLRSQQRIRLHICLFATLLLYSISALLWECLVIKDILKTPLPNSFVHTKPNACKAIDLMNLLAKTSSFFWMFCEGFHLHWLMVKTFKPINTMVVYITIGWGIPTCLVLVYICLRIVHYNIDSCWMGRIDSLEWIVNAPTIACIALNVIFLVLILRTLVFKLKKQQDNVGSLRRAMKALLFLVPLLGLQQFFILYRPNDDQPGYFIYTIVSTLVVNTQGAVVAIIFCFLNSEVQMSVIQCFKRLRQKLQPDITRTATALSMVSMAPRISLSPLCSPNLDLRDSPAQSLTELHLQHLRVCYSAREQHEASSDQSSYAGTESVDIPEISDTDCVTSLNRASGIEETTKYSEVPVMPESFYDDLNSLQSHTMNEVILRADAHLEGSPLSVSGSLQTSDDKESDSPVFTVKTRT